MRRNCCFGTQFTSFPSRKVQILTPEELQDLLFWSTQLPAKHGMSSGVSFRAIHRCMHGERMLCILAVEKKKMCLGDARVSRMRVCEHV
jgi:hypothetical protein